jgi:hypothetical protein
LGQLSSKERTGRQRCVHTGQKFPAGTLIRDRREYDPSSLLSDCKEQRVLFLDELYCLGKDAVRVKMIESQ